ncbi:hypothetical protein CC1G_00295 [Coprinopsis cinerea okayama7|uniref:Secreted protein n=1 Tax=Coprinopsis cinerea (strain Okayama-7 / 130 / ATCC MYA-4618 / FGSC 9003) TaxID=240176 RepID=A8NXG2_COPC7|nr:hypothetical protein CC1G_00295 [Coprinopsis cinerea okayama7\|eukprot:XP_001837159.2 hypothetical protein CC1G_00295 [Coprinopsis cinerea okayama7\
MRISLVSSLLSVFSSSVVLALKTPPLFSVQESHLGGPDSVILGDVMVPVHLGVMSRCPDALLCESVFDEVLGVVGDKVELSLVFVARIDPSQPDGVKCLHGAVECAANTQQLCAAKYNPFSKWWAFVQCGNYHGKDKIGLPETVSTCAKAAEIDWEGSGAAQCAGKDGRGEEGLQLLKDSIHLGNEFNIQKSCTVLISGRKICVHDGTWKECENGHSVQNFVDQIEEEYRRLNSL